MLGLEEWIEGGRKRAEEAGGAVLGYDAARTKADAEGGIVCAFKDAEGRKHFFAMPRDATDVEVRDEAFRLRNGREVSPLERDLLAIAERRGSAS